MNANFIFSQKYSDHPEFGRYGNSTISHQEQSNLNEYKLALGPVINDSMTKILKVEGKVMMTLYNGPEDASTYEIFQAYRELLLSKDFEILFSCSKGECGEKFLGAYYDLAPFAYDFGYNSSAPIAHGNKDVSHIIVGKKLGGETTTYVSLIVTQG